MEVLRPKAVRPDLISILDVPAKNHWKKPWIFTFCSLQPSRRLVKTTWGLSSPPKSDDLRRKISGRMKEWHRYWILLLIYIYINEKYVYIYVHMYIYIYIVLKCIEFLPWMNNDERSYWIVNIFAYGLGISEMFLLVIMLCWFRQLPACRVFWRFASSHKSNLIGLILIQSLSILSLKFNSRAII